MSRLTHFWKSAEAVGPSEQSIVLARIMRNEVVRFYQEGNLEDALNTARQLLELQRRELGQSHPDISVGLKNISALERLRDAERLGSDEFSPTPRASAPTRPVDPDAKPVPQAARVEHAAIAILDQIAHLDYQGDGDHTCLAAVQIEARQAREAVDLGRHPSSALLEGFATLLYMLSNGSSLGNEEWISVHDAIAKQFGRPLARAAGSGKIVMSHPNPGIPLKTCSN